MTGLSFNSENVHDLHLNGGHILFHVPTTGLFQLDELGSDLLALLRSGHSVNESEVKQGLGSRHSPNDIAEIMEEFTALGIIGDTVPNNPLPKTIDEFPLSTIILNVNTGCNLSCTYCYKEDLTDAASGERMDFETARKSVELLLSECGDRDRINIVFFGGEPLTNLPLIKQVVAYAEERAAQAGKGVDFSLTTNATMLTEEIVDYFDQHAFGIAVSIDGPRAVHDKNRITTSGNGTYDVVRRKVEMLLSRYHSRPVGARVTLTHGTTDVLSIHRHLKQDLGFFEVGFAPVTAGDIASYNLTADELSELFSNMKVLGGQYRDAAISGHNNGFANMHQLMTDLYEGARKAVPCGAGLGLLAVDKEGDLNLCHRFTGSDLPTFGNADVGIDKNALGSFVNAAMDKTGLGCESCRVRNLCSGGCYHESYAQYGDPMHPVHHYCDLLRDWIDFGVAVYMEILEKNPNFFERHVVPRSPAQGISRSEPAMEALTL